MAIQALANKHRKCPVDLQPSGAVKCYHHGRLHLGCVFDEAFVVPEASSHHLELPPCCYVRAVLKAALMLRLDLPSCSEGDLYPAFENASSATCGSTVEN
jgi:hypothetical protein